MDSLVIIRRLHEHRIWANRLLRKCTASLTDDQLHSQFEIGQGTVWRTLCHLYGAEYVWLATLEGNENPTMPGDRADGLPGNQKGEGAIQSFSELEQQWNELDQQWSGYIAKLSEDDLSDPVFKVSSLSGKRIATARYDVLTHVCTHAHYTIAQLINMLRQLGVSDLPDVMLISMAREQASKV